MARPAHVLMVELRQAQKDLIAAKKRGKKESTERQRARIAELQREMETAV
jgi:hypothetical protein